MLKFKKGQVVNGWLVTYSCAIGVYVFEKGFISIIGYPSSNKFREGGQVKLGFRERIGLENKEGNFVKN